MQRALRLSFLPLLVLLSGLAGAHDDDPKVLSTRPPKPGKGYRNAMVSDPGANSGNINLGGGGFDADGITLLSWLPLSEFGVNSQNGADCWGYIAPSGREYAIFCHWDATAFVEVTDPGNPVIVADIDGPNSLWRDAKVFGQYCYVVTEESPNGVQVIDMGNIDGGVVSVVGTFGSGDDSTHNVAIDTDSGYLYRCGGNGLGLRIHDLNASPTNPPEVATWNTRYVHDAQIVTYTSGPYAGRQIAFCSTGFNSGWSSPGLDVLDVTNKSNIFVMDNFLYPGAVYSHQGWLSPDRQYYFHGDELDEGTNGVPSTTFVLDVSNLNNVFLAGSFSNGNPAVTHNLYTDGSLVFEANYRSGLRVFDTSSSVTSPTEVAWFDTYPANDGVDYNGLWSCWPYFPSGTIIGSDRESGLFVWRLDAAELTFSFPAGVPTTLDPAGDTMAVVIGETAPGDYQPGTAFLHVDSGSGYASFPMTDQGGGNFLAPFPATACGSQVDFYVSADGASGTTYASPADAPLSVYNALSAQGVTTVASDDMESTAGWTAGLPGDDATTGIWTQVDPNGTAAQPEDDHTPGTGTRCWVTGQGTAGGSNGQNDVDGGVTSLLTPAYDLSGLVGPTIRYWRWYSNSTGPAPNQDVFEVDISNDDGASWTSVEVVGPGGPQADGGWFEHSFAVADLVVPTATVRLRFRASDEGTGSIVEAAVDDLAIEDVECDDCSASTYCQTAPNSVGGGALISSSGTTSVVANDLVLETVGAVGGQFGLFYYGPNQIQVPFGDGFRCVGSGGVGLFRLNPPGMIDPFGDLSRTLDLTQPPANAGPGMIQAGDEWNFQFWYRDPGGPGGTGFNFSDGLNVHFCP
ncbi:MAG: choice-of-anchor B family protein [Planctomycetota bacterium]|jgi:choice-of-anchor B domain-containing protein|nr:choice-of-anchor B family protein [Planctomycetota bacterium]